MMPAATALLTKLWTLEKYLNCTADCKFDFHEIKIKAPSELPLVLEEPAFGGYLVSFTRLSLRPTCLLPEQIKLWHGGMS